MSLASQQRAGPLRDPRDRRVWVMTIRLLMIPSWTHNWLRIQVGTWLTVEERPGSMTDQFMDLSTPPSCHGQGIVCCADKKRWVAVVINTQGASGRQSAGLVARLGCQNWVWAWGQMSLQGTLMLAPCLWHLIGVFTLSVLWMSSLIMLQQIAWSFSAARAPSQLWCRHLIRTFFF